MNFYLAIVLRFGAVLVAISAVLITVGSVYQSDGPVWMLSAFIGGGLAFGLWRAARMILVRGAEEVPF